MGTITSGVGLISGINTGQLINSLIAIDAQPVNDLQNQIALYQSEEAAYQAISANLLAAKQSADTFSQPGTFTATKATSSNTTALTVSSTNSATPGTYTFNVAQVATSQQLITRGFADQSTTPVGAGTLTLESAAARLDSTTALAQLNGGAGISRGAIRITDGSGASATVDLSTAVTVNDVLNDINSASGINVTASIVGDHLQLVDNSGGSKALAVSDVNSSGTSASLGLNAASVNGTLTGSQINKVTTSTLLSNLNDGAGVRFTAGKSNFTITATDGSSFNVTINAGDSTLGSIISDINSASGGKVTAAVNSAGTGLQLTDSAGGGGTLSVAAANGSSAAADLGILGSANSGKTALTGGRLIAEIDSKLVSSLNGGSGATLGTISITNMAGTVTQVDLSHATSVQDILNAINSANAGVTASLNNAGNGLELTDNTGSTSATLSVSGTGASALGLTHAAVGNTLDSGSLHLRYVSGATLLSTLNGGQGVSLGKFTLTDSRGVSSTINLAQGSVSTVQDVLNAINNSGLDVKAVINSNGDGITLQDTGPGTIALSVAEVSGGTTATGLGLVGTAASPGASLTGSFATTISIAATDTLGDVVNKINNSGAGVTAQVLNDGSSSAPYRLSLTSAKTGQAGAFILDDGGLNFQASSLVDAHNAVVFYGSGTASQSLLLSSSNNTFTDVIPGTTITANAVSSGPVQVTIASDTSGITSAIQSFVTSFNSVVTSLDQYDSYDSTNQQAGLLLGDATVEQIRTSLFSMVNSVNTKLSGTYNSLASVGITVGSNDQLQLDTSTLATALQTNPSAVAQLFTATTTTTNSDGTQTVNPVGTGVQLDQLLSSITDSSTGLITQRNNTLNSEIQLDTGRITDLNTQLAAKKAQLQEEFNNMETTLAQLQSQNAALQSFINSNSSSSSSSTTSSSSSSGSSSSSSTTA
jgi:flagellar hook-associated protein 2